MKYLFKVPLAFSGKGTVWVIGKQRLSLWTETRMLINLWRRNLRLIFQRNPQVRKVIPLRTSVTPSFGISYKWFWLPWRPDPGIPHICNNLYWNLFFPAVAAAVRCQCTMKKPHQTSHHIFCVVPTSQRETWVPYSLHWKIAKRSRAITAKPVELALWPSTTAHIIQIWHGWVYCTVIKYFGCRYFFCYQNCKQRSKFDIQIKAKCNSDITS